MSTGHDQISHNDVTGFTESGEVYVGLSGDYKMDSISLTHAENYNLDQILSYMTNPVQWI